MSSAECEKPSGRLSLRVLIVLLVLLGSCLSAGAEEEEVGDLSDEAPLAKVSLGFKSGLSPSQHVGSEERNSEYEVDSEWRTGLSLGFFVHWPVTERFGIQQEVVYTQKGSRQSISVDILEIPTTMDVTYEMDYLEFPILMRFEWLQTDRFSVYSLAGTAMSLKISDRYTLSGELDDGEQVVSLRADSDMSEVDMFDYSMIYGTGLEIPWNGRHVIIEYRFVSGWNTLSMPTYAYVPFGDEEILIDNEPVQLKNQSHTLMLGLSF